MSYKGTRPTSTTQTLTPQSADPANPKSGEVFESDGTVRPAGLWRYNGTDWIKVGDGEVKNYITNGRAENSTVGWAAYVDAADAKPVDGVGGAPTLAITTQTANVLEGVNSFRITKDALNRQGEGVSYDFTIDAAYKTSMFKIELAYDASANYDHGSDPASDPSDLVFYVYDKDSASVIQPFTFTTDGSGHFVGYFQPVDSTSRDYRLIAHVATSNALAWTFDCDVIKVGPSSVSTGPVISDWQDYTPTGTFTTNTTYTGKWRRSGPDLEFQIGLTFSGAPNATTLEDITLPSGLAIDTTKLVLAGTGGKDVVGILQMIDTGSSLFEGSIRVDPNTPNTLQPTYDVPASSTGFITQAAPFTIGNTDTIMLNGRVPIQGWGANGQVGVDDGRPVTSVYTSTAGQSIPGGSGFHIIDFGTKENDTHGAVTTGASWKFTAPISGMYSVKSSVLWGNAVWTASTLRQISLFVNGVQDETIGYDQSQASTTQFVWTGGSTDIFLNAGDFIDVRARNGEGVARVLEASANNVNIEIHRIGGSATVQPSDIVAARYVYSGTQSFPNATNTTMLPTSKEYDTHGVFASGIYTAPAPGYYEVNAYINLNSATQGVGEVAMYVLKNAETASGSNRVDRDLINSANQGAQGSATRYLEHGDTIKVQLFQSNGVARSNENNTGYVEVKRLK